MGVIAERPEEPFGIRVCNTVMHHLILEVHVLGFARKSAVYKEVRGLEEIRVDSELLDGVASTKD